MAADIRGAIPSNPGMKVGLDLALAGVLVVTLAGWMVCLTRRSKASRREMGLWQGRSRVLESLAQKRELSEVLQGIVEYLALAEPGLASSILILDPHQRLRLGITGGLPEFLQKALDGLEPGEDALACGRAAALKRPVLVADILRDPSWAPLHEPLESTALRACWSVPIMAPHDQVLGTLAMYCVQPREPRPAELDLLIGAAGLAALAIENAHSEQRLRDSEAHLAEAQRIAHVGSWRGDPQSGALRWSDEMYRIFGWPLDRPVTHDDFMRVIHPEDIERLRAEQGSAGEGRASGDTEYRLIRPNGEVRYVRERCTFGKDDQGRPSWIEGVVLDVTEQKRAEEERLKLERHLQQTQRLESLGLLAGGIAHDFNNILMAIIGNAEIARQELPRGSAVGGLIEKIEQSSWRAADLSQQMLAYAGRGRFVSALLDLNKILSEMLPVIRAAIPNSVKYQFEGMANLPAIKGDAAQLRQIVVSLITNAAEAMRDKDGAIRVATGLMHGDRAFLDDVLDTVRASQEEPLPVGAYVFLEVVDNGCGMDPEVQKKMFDPFFTTKFTGRGLGLAAVLGMVRGHRGTIKVRSAPGQGCHVRILFPVAPVSGEAEPAPSVSAPADAAARPRPTILLVDDEEAVRVVCRRLLEHLGCDVLLAADGPAALELCRRHTDKIDGVLLDLTMPRLNGDQVFLRLREMKPDLKVILYSGYNEQEASQRFAALGINGFLQKPFNLASLKEKLKSIGTAI